MEEKHYCHSCGAESDWQCRDCEQCVCENCTVPFTYMNQIDYTLCNNCHDSYQEEHAEEQYQESLSVEGLKKYLEQKRIIDKFVKTIKNRFGKVK